MKKTYNCYFIIFIITFTCSSVFKISFTDYIDIKYLFPHNSIYIAISILLNYFYLKILFNCIESYIRMDILIISRIGKKTFNRKLIIHVFKCLMIFLLLSIIFDLFLYRKFYFEALLITIFLELVIGLFMIRTFKKLSSNLVLISLIIIIILRLFFLLWFKTYYFYKTNFQSLQTKCFFLLNYL